MPERCSRCKLKYERAPGYFLGSTYINYAATALLSLIGYVVLVFGAGWDNREVLLPLLAFVIVFPLAFFKFARSLWIGFDCWFDRTGFESDDPTG